MKFYFKLCLLMPLWLPVIVLCWAYGLEALDLKFLDGLPDWIGGVALIIGASIFFGGIQYCIALAILWMRIDFENTRSWVRHVLVLPLLFTVFQVLGMALFGWRQYSTHDWEVLPVVAGIDLALGYAYVVIWLLGLGVIEMFQVRRKVKVIA